MRFIHSHAGSVSNTKATTVGDKKFPELSTIKTAVFFMQTLQKTCSSYSKHDDDDFYILSFKKI